jgi:hypothetical protein
VPLEPQVAAQWQGGQRERVQDGEGELPDHECETTGDKAKDEGAGWTCACSKRVDPRSGAYEKRNRVDGKREEQPAEYP